MIQTLAPDRTDETFREGILPGAVRRGEDFLDPQARHAVAKLSSVDLVAIAEEIGGGGVVREGVYNLLGGPVGGGVLGHIEADDTPAIVSEDDDDHGTVVVRQLFERGMAHWSFARELRSGAAPRTNRAFMIAGNLMNRPESANE